MKHQLEKVVGQTVALQTKEGLVVGILEKVTDQGIYLKALPKKDRHGLDVEHVFFGGGYYPYGGFGYPGFGYGYPGLGFGGVGFGAGIGVGVGFGAGIGYGFRRPFLW